MEQQNFLLFDELLDGVQILDTELTYCYMNAMARQQLGLEEEVGVGTDFRSICTYRKLDRVFQVAENCLKNGSASSLKTTMHLSSGEERHLALRFLPVPTGLMITSITTEFGPTGELKDNVYNMLCREMHEAFVLVKAERAEDGRVEDVRIVAVNDQAAKSFKQSPSKLIGKLRSKTLQGPPNQRTLDLYDRIFNHGETFQFEYNLPGTESYFSVNHFKPDADHLATLTTNITEIKTASRELKKLNQQLEYIVSERTWALQEALEREMTSSAMKATFLSMTSHELHTPLASIQLSLKVLEKYNVGEHQKKRIRYHEHIRKETNNLLEMLTSIKGDCTMMNREDFLTKGEVKLITFVGEIVHEMDLLAQPKQRIIVNHEGEKVVKIDGGILRRILINLLSNAMKYSKKDVQLRVRVEDETMTIMVKDQGIGIPAAEHKSVFSKNFRAGNTGKIAGTGLGLSIVASYVELLGGDIEFESTEGKGTSFWVSVPVTIVA